MLQVTPEATAYMLEARRQAGIDPARMPRLVCRRDQVVLTFAERPARGNRAIVGGHVLVYVDPTVARRLDRGVVDARPEGANTILVIREPRLMPPGLQWVN